MGLASQHICCSPRSTACHRRLPCMCTLPVDFIRRVLRVLTNPGQWRSSKCPAHLVIFGTYSAHDYNTTTPIRPNPPLPITANMVICSAHLDPHPPSATTTHFNNVQFMSER